MNTLKLLNFNDSEIVKQLNRLDTTEKLILANKLLLQKEKQEKRFNAVVKIMTFRKLIEKKLKVLQKAQTATNLELLGVNNE